MVGNVSNLEGSDCDCGGCTGTGSLWSVSVSASCVTRPGLEGEAELHPSLLGEKERVLRVNPRPRDGGGMWAEGVIVRPG